MNQPILASINTDDFCTEDMPKNMNVSMLAVAAAIEKAINDLVSVGFKAPITIGWHNIQSLHHNPNGILGFFRVTANGKYSDVSETKGKINE